MQSKTKTTANTSYHQKRKARGDRQISFWLSADEFEQWEQVRQSKGLSFKDLFLQSIQSETKPLPIDSGHSIDHPQEAILLAECSRGELFVFQEQKDFLLVTILLDREQLPEWHPLEISCIKDFDHAEDAIRYFCQNPKQFPKFAQTVLMRRADEGHLGFAPAKNHWYYVAHILFEVYPRQMNAYGDFETYDNLLAHWMLDLF